MHPTLQKLFRFRTALLLGLALLGATAAAAHETAAIRGTVTAVDAAGGTLTITPRHGDAVTLHVDKHTRLVLNGDPAKLADLPVGASARAVYDPATLTAARVIAHAESTAREVEGAVTAVGTDSLTITPAAGEGGSAAGGASAGDAGDTGEQHKPVELKIDASTKILLDGDPAKLDAIKVGDHAHALYDGVTLLATLIQAQSPHHELADVAGTVTAVAADSITIAPEDGKPVKLGTTATTQVFKNGVLGKLSDVKVGDRARALYDSVTLVAAVIQAQSPHHELAEVEGKVTAVSASSITITPGSSHGDGSSPSDVAGSSAGQGAPVTLGTSASTQVFLDGKVSSLGKLAVGDSARALYDSATLTAVAILAHTSDGGD